METKEHTRRRRTLRCSLCGLEITEGEDYWYCNGSSVCGACFSVFARAGAGRPPGAGKGGGAMTLLEMSALYAESAAALRRRIGELRQAARELKDEEDRRLLRRRITELTPLLQETRELAALTAHYYEQRYQT
ncbi:hypothetical protein [Dysosmobacter welbionis]|uniref:hypothetical protein n=1 Tax=Dysosmobacter welbionis TaxID=2093857 RepID=UPI00300F5707